VRALVARGVPVRAAGFGAAADRGAGVPAVALDYAGADRLHYIPHHAVERHLGRAGVRYTLLRAGFFAQNKASPRPGRARRSDARPPPRAGPDDDGALHR
jgi:uncharacterized protein YbjT (DUF2867 family)